MTLETNLTMIKLLLNDIRSGAKFNSNDTKVLRYLISNVYNATLHEKLGIDKDIESPDVVYMSESFKLVWEAAGKPTGGSALKKFGIHEHVVPLNILIRMMVKECFDEETIYDFVRENKQLVFVTKDEDKALNEAGYQRVMPKDGDRYSIVGIKVHPEPVLYKNFGKYKHETF
jgi:hypothetical protein